MKLAAAAARRFVSSPDPKIRAALVYGPNRALAGEYAAAIAKAFGAERDAYASTRLAEDELKKDKARLADALAARSLLGGAELVWVKADGESAADSIVAGLDEIESGAERAFLLVESGDLGSRAKTVAAFEKAERAAAIACYEESEAERAAFVKSLIEERRVPLTADARDLFLTQAPVDRALARIELEKLALYAHGLGRPVEMDEVAALAAFESEGALDEAASAALTGRLGEALATLDRIEGGNGVSIIKAMERRLMRLLEARVMVDRGVSPTDAGDRLKPKVFWKERDAFAAQLRRWNVERLAAAVGESAAAEKRAKTAGAPQAEIAADLFRRVAVLAKGSS